LVIQIRSLSLQKEQMQKRMYILIVVGLAIVVLYAIPVPQKDFTKLFKGAKSINNSLLSFREMPTKSIQLNDSKWEYLVLDRDAPTILFLHGMGGGYDIWWQQIESLKSDYKIISITLPPVESMDEAANGLLAILDAEQVEKTVVVGSSMGGYIAQYLLTHHPSRISKIILGNTFPPNKELAEKNKTISRLVPYLPAWLIMKKFRKNLSEKVIPNCENSPLVEAYLMEQYYGKMSKKQFIGRMNVVFDPFYPDLSEIQRMIPKLIIESDNDPLVPIGLREKLKRLFPEASVYTFTNEAGHFTYLNRPDEYTRVIRAFLNDTNDAQVQSLIQNYFVGRRTADIDLLKKTFHPSARLMTTDTSLTLITRRQYLDVVQKRGKVSCETTLKSLEIDNKRAFAKTKFDYGDRVYEDYLTLIKIKEKWWIMNKTFERTK